MDHERQAGGFQQFLTDFAEAVEMAAAGETEEGYHDLIASQRNADRDAVDSSDRMAGAYRYEVARRVYAGRYLSGFPLAEERAPIARRSGRQI